MPNIISIDYCYSSSCYLDIAHIVLCCIHNIFNRSSFPMLIELSSDYGWVLLSASIMGFSCLVIGFIFAGLARSEVFTEKYMNENFGAEHRRMSGEDIKKGGYPDNGSGYYTKNLTYEQWYILNNGQRAHMNFVEWIATSLVLLLIGGLSYPITCASLGLGVVVSRFLYAAGYRRGPSSRLVGALLNDVFVFALFVFSIIASVDIIRKT